MNDLKERRRRFRGSAWANMRRNDIRLEANCREFLALRRRRRRRRQRDRQGPSVRPRPSVRLPLVLPGLLGRTDGRMGSFARSLVVARGD